MLEMFRITKARAYRVKAENQHIQSQMSQFRKSENKQASKYTRFLSNTRIFLSMSLIGVASN